MRHFYQRPGTDPLVGSTEVAGCPGLHEISDAVIPGPGGLESRIFLDPASYLSSIFLLLGTTELHPVLDLCAAPGVKSLILSTVAGSREVFAFDVSGKRLDVANAIKTRFGDAPVRFFVANSACLNLDDDDLTTRQWTRDDFDRYQKGGVFPAVRYDEYRISQRYYGSESSRKRHHRTIFAFHVPGMFHHVLVDAECTHDGSAIHNEVIGKGWKDATSIAKKIADKTRGGELFRLQTMLLGRGLEHLAPGGRLVYSTCSRNSNQNEAVVANVLSSQGTDVFTLTADEILLIGREAGLELGRWIERVVEGGVYLKGAIFFAVIMRKR